MKRPYIQILLVGLCLLVLGVGNVYARERPTQPNGNGKPETNSPGEIRSSNEGNAIEQILEEYRMVMAHYDKGFETIYNSFILPYQKGEYYNREALQQGVYMLQSYIYELGIPYSVRYPCHVSECLAHISRMSARYSKWREWQLHAATVKIADLLSNSNDQ